MNILLLPFLLGNDPAIAVESAKPLPELTRKLEQTRGWTGGDGAASVRLSDKRALWLFADTWIGKIENGRRKEMRMVNNTAAWHDLDGEGKMQFFWDASGKAPAAILRPAQPDCWYWPGDGVLIDGKLYIFCKLVRRKADGAPGFQFDWFGNEMVQIDNPHDEPTRWRCKRMRLSEGTEEVRLGTSATLDGNYLYVYGLFSQNQCKPFKAPLALARISSKKIERLDRGDWEFLCHSTSGLHWNNKAADLAPLFTDGGSEQSVARVRGIDGFVAVYQAFGLSRDIMLRHAPRPEGPWSAPVKIYQCPEAGKVFMYAANLHLELATRPGQLILTYCRNTGDLGEHVRRPDLYVPQAVEVQLKLPK